MSETITILVPCYNVEKYVDECLMSIKNQTYPHLEVICINDGSTDGTLDILKRYESADKRFHVINKPNSGYGASMNLGLSKATGDFVGIVESDDFIEPQMFEKLIKIAVENNLDVARGCYFNYKTADNSNELVSNDFVPKNTIVEPLLNQSPFYQAPSIWAAIYRRSMLIENQIKFLETPGASYQDTAFAFKVYCCAKRFMMINDGVLHYRTDNDSSSVNNPKKVFCVCDEYAEMWRFARENRARYDAVKYLIPILQMATYSWNYNRLASSYRKGFIMKWSEELRGQIRNRLIKFNAYKMSKRIKIIRIAYFPFSMS